MRFTYFAERRFGYWECSEKSAEVARQDVREPLGTERAAGILAVVVGRGNLAYTRDDGVHVIPAALLGA